MFILVMVGILGLTNIIAPDHLRNQEVDDSQTQWDVDKKNDDSAQNVKDIPQLNLDAAEAKKLNDKLDKLSAECRGRY